MGYWAKDGSYVREENDANPLSQSEIWEEEKKGAEWRARDEERKRQQAEREREERIWMAETDRLIAENKRKEEERLRKEEEDRRYEKDTMLWLKNPRNLDERRARANYWRLQSTWSILISKINGKDKKFGILWDKYSHAQSEEEKAMIVEQMEKLYPTTKGRLSAAEKQEGRGR